jgi:hypothetical protein
VRCDLIIISIAYSVSFSFVNAKSHSGVHIRIFKLFFFGEEATEELAEEAHDNGLCLVKGMCGDVSGFDVIDVVDWSLKQL